MTAAQPPGSVGGDSLRVMGAQVVGNAGYFVSVLLLARALTPDARGTVAFVTVAALVTATVAGAGVGDATRVLAATRPELRSRLLTNVVLLSAAFAATGAALACGVLAALPDARPAGVGALELALLGLGTMTAATMVAGVCFLQGCGRFRVYSRIAAAGPWVYALLLVALWRGGDVTVRGAATAWVVAQAAPAVALLGAAARDAGFGRPDIALVRESLHFGVRAWIGGLAHFLNARVDQLLLGVIATEAALGAYAVAVNASEVLFYLPSAVGTALLPAVAREGAAAGPERTLRIFRAVALVTLAASALAAAVGPTLLPLVFGEAYRASVGPFLWLLPGAMGFAASAIFSTAMLACSFPAASSLGPLVALVVGVALDVLLIPAYGASGAAAAASAALLCGGTAAALAYRALIGLPLSALVPRRTDVAVLTRLTSRRAGTIPS